MFNVNYDLRNFNVNYELRFKTFIKRKIVFKPYIYLDLQMIDTKNKYDQFMWYWI